MTFPPTPTQVQCPSCGARLATRVYHIVDAREQPELKEALLAGELNLFQCPACGAVGALQAPLLYHDASKELFLLYVPMGLNLPATQEERLIAELTNAVINATPPQERKGYLLRPPTRVISLQGLVEPILQADGISPEAIREQTELIRLVGTLAEFVDDEDKLRELVEQNREKIGYQLLLLLGATIDATARRGDEQTLERYTRLRDKLIELAQLDPSQVPNLGPEASYDHLIAMLRELPPDQVRGAVAANRPLIDYGFFLHLSNQMEQASGQERAALENLRNRLVALTDEMDQEAKEAMERASAQLGEILRAHDPQAAIAERLDELDEAFLVVLSANIQAAQQQGREDVVEVLNSIYRTVITMLQERLRPELQILNRLLQSQDQGERQRLIAEALETYNPAGFLDMVREIAADVEEQGGDASTLAALERIEAEVQAAIQGAAPGGARGTGGVLLTPDQTSQPSEPPKIFIPGRD